MRMVNLSTRITVPCGVLGGLMAACGGVMTTFGILWMSKFFAELEKFQLGRFSHLESGHGLWSGVLFCTAGTLGEILRRRPTKQLLVAFLAMCCVVTVVGCIEVGLLGDFLTSPTAKYLDVLCTSSPAGDPTGDLACQFMLFFQGIAAAAGVGMGLAIGGICVAIVGLCTEQNPGLISQEVLPQPQGPVVMTQPGQFIAVQHSHTSIPLPYNPGTHVVPMTTPGQVYGQNIAATVPADQNVPCPPAYTK